MKMLPSLGITVLVSACASAPRASLEPLRALRTVEVTYAATLAPTAGVAHDWQPCAPAERAAADARPAPARPGVEIECHIFAIDRALSPALAGRAETSVYGRILEASEAERLHRSAHRVRGVTIVNAPTLTLPEAQPGNLTLVSSTPFVSAFVVAESQGTFIADPRVTSFDDGLEIEVTPTLAADIDGAELAFAIRGTKLAGTIGETTLCMPGTAVPVTLEIPIAWSESLTTRARLGPNEALLIGSLSSASADECLVVLVRARRSRAQ